MFHVKRFRGGDAQARMGWWCGILYVSRETFGVLSSEALVRGGYYGFAVCGVSAATANRCCR
ncbi:hypothetical protein HMPREF0580_0309 [Mobiluncus mulieris ATCC 35239]|uniref:Uncharacterized protein n=1 Tax=Mobiluncus mulieris ATCC 35239 TaxID=871571 RepID=E0QN45_9ACTO|nr:hypothetical protein HMPREF0580_0309 [Mobiluncus mulieris ATCC 35239]